jgi:surface antigen
VGAVVVRRSTSNNPKSPAFFGHVAVIDAVAADDQTITVSAYNAGLNGRFSVETGTLPSLQFDDVIHFEKFATKNLPPPPLPDPRGHHPAQWNYRS